MTKILFKTERLIGRKFEITDAEFVFELFNTPKWIKNIGDRNINTILDAENYIVNKIFKSYETNGFGFYVIELKSGQTPIGISGFAQRKYLEQEDIGFALLPQFEGKGFAYESSKACLLYGIKEFAFQKINGITLLENQPSRNLLEKLGLTYQQTIAEPDTHESLALYSLDIEM